MVVDCAVTNSPVPETLRADVEAATELVPPEWFTPLTWQKMALLVPLWDDKPVDWRSEEVGNGKLGGWVATDKANLKANKLAPPAAADRKRGEWFDRLLKRLLDGVADDADVLHAVPARTKTDLSIRRTRFGDLWRAARYLGRAIDWKKWWTKWAATDYITMLNLSWAELLLTKDGDSWAERMDGVGAFDGDLTHMMNVFKKVSDLLKTRPSEISKERFCECAVLSGYRNPPFPGFDFQKEAAALAEGRKDEHDTLEPFGRVAREELKMAVPMVKWLTFEEWFSEVEWLTTGSSSIGVVKWRSADGQTGEFKARKNLLPEVINMEEWVKLAWSNKRQVNRAIIKSELGKLRIAVSADIETYWQMTYVTYLLNGAYKQWPGSTIEEDTAAQTDRLIAMMRLLAKKYGLPFDYKGFDHQPTTNELIMIVNVLCVAAEANVPRAELGRFRDLSERIKAGFRNSVLVASRDGVERTYIVEGGLMSGLRWTTIVGNAWNTVMTAMVRRTLVSIGVDEPTVGRWIRGDDSAIYCSSWAKAMAFKLGYDSMEVESGAGKFSIQSEAMEFLRVWFTPKRLMGYAARALPGLTQRKPWSSAEWTPFGALEAVRDTLSTLERRGCDADDCAQIWLAVRDTYCRKAHVDKRWFAVPREQGGAGLEAWEGWSCNATLPKLDREVEITNGTGWTERRIAERAAETGLKPNSERAAVLAAKALSSKLSADDVIEVSALFRRRFKEALDKLKPEWSRVPHETQTPIYSFAERYLVNLDAQDGVIRRAKAALEPDSDFGKWAKVKSDWDFVHDWYRGGKEAKLWLRTHWPACAWRVRQLEKHGLRRREALGWVFGELGYATPSSLHPALSSLRDMAAVKGLGRPWRRSWRAGEWASTVTWMRRAATKTMLESALAKEVYSW